MSEDRIAELESELVELKSRTDELEGLMHDVSVELSSAHENLKRGIDLIEVSFSEMESAIKDINGSS